MDLMDIALMIALKALKGVKKLSANIGETVKDYIKENPITVTTDKTLTKTDIPADAKATGNALGEKANGAGITFSINESGGVRVTYDDGE